MKEMHRLIVTSETYKLASDAEPALAATQHADRPGERLPLALPAAAARGRADLGFDSVARRRASTSSVGGPSFDVGGRRSEHGAANAVARPT